MEKLIIYQGTLWLTPQGWEAMGFSAETARTNIAKGRPGWSGIVKEGRGKEARYRVDSLPARLYRLVAKELCGGERPERWAERQAAEAEKAARQAAEAEKQARLSELIEHFRHPDDYRYYVMLPLAQGLETARAKAAELSEAAALMRMLGFVRTQPEAQRWGFESKKEIYRVVYDRYSVSPIEGFRPKRGSTFTAFVNSLQKKVQKFKKEGKPSLVDARGKTGNRGKIRTEEQKAVLRKAFGTHTAPSAVRIMEYYNSQAEKKGWPTVAIRTVRNWVKDPEIRKWALAGRKGVAAWEDVYLPVIDRERPSQPLYFLTVDGTPVDLYLEDWGRNTGVVVIDPYNYYPLGWSWGKKETYQLIQEAWANALAHVRELAGCYLLPWQIQADNFAKKVTTGLYRQLAYFEDFAHAKPGKARVKPIESWFGNKLRYYLKEFPNWAGANVASKDQPNREIIQHYVKQFPDAEVGRLQMQMVIEAVRNEESITKEGEVTTRQGHYQMALRELPEADRREMHRLEYLALFGRQHQWTNEITNRGVGVSLEGNNTTRRYWLLEKDFFDCVGLKCQVYYDPADLGNIALYQPAKRQWYLASEKEKVPMALKDYKEGTREKLNKILEFRNNQVAEYLKKQEKDRERLEAGKVPAENMLRAMPTINGQQKNYLKDAEDEVKRRQVQEPGGYNWVITDAQDRLNEEILKQTQRSY